MAAIDGSCDPRFAAVRDAFVTNLDERGELGGSLCIRVEGRTVVDLWGGHRDRAGTLPWERDTLVNAWSVGKGVLAILALALVERGELSLDAPVCERWPEFASGGKDRATLRTLLGHRVGLPSVRNRLDEHAWSDWEAMCQALSAQEPWWAPDTAHGYHTNTFGFLVGEAIRRSTGERPGEALRRIVTGPLDADFHWGLPAALHPRVAEVDTMQTVLTEREQWALAFPPSGDDEHDTMVWHGYFNPPGLSGLGVMHTRAWLEAEVPSTNGQATARAVAAIYDAVLHGLADGSPLFGPELRAAATRTVSDGEDRILGRRSRFGLGFQLPIPERPLGASPNAFGHYGYGGLLGFADPDAGLAFAFLTSRPGDRWQTPRTNALVDACYSSLGVG